ncbi:MAG: PSD1 domain-containing protein [Planctomyces sp.]|nr:PSD1 domain-containing protein [Planctomyces sp.]
MQRNRLTGRLASLFVSVNAVTGLLLAGSIPANADDIRFSRDIQPILASNCLNCHGADEHKREAGLRLDTFDGATALHEDSAAVVPGKPDDSELIRRITSSDPELRMPPVDTGKSLTDEQVQMLRKWITSGAEYQQHWAFQPPVRPEVPAIRDQWIRNPIDAFVMERLAKEGLKPSPAAAPETLIRRLSLDVTGLPPASELVQHLTASSDSNQILDDKWWSESIDAALASPHYGEKWGRTWLDAARYADSDGFEKDKPRFVWFYRDWVVKSFNNDLPYNQFLTEQLAGDLLPNRTQDQLVATGFLRNSMINEEGGVDPEQFRMEAMFDRMDAIGKAMLGLTIQCTQCHNHKYDPLTQQEYYRMFAFLNNCDEAQATVYTDEETKRRQEILSATAVIEEELRRSHQNWSEQLSDWLRATAAESNPWQIVRPELDASGGQKHYLLEDGSILAQGYAPTKHTTEFTVDTDLKSLSGFRIELLNDGNLPHNGPGRSVDGLCALSEFQVTVIPKTENAQPIQVRFVEATADASPAERELAAIYSDKSKDRRVTGPISFAIDGNNHTAWGIDIGGGRSNVPRNAVFIPESSLSCEAGFRVTFKLVQMHGGWNSDDNQNNNLGRFRLSLTDAPHPTADPVPPAVRQIAEKSKSGSTALDSLNATEISSAFSYWRTRVDDWKAANEQIEQLWANHPRGTTQLVLQERAVPRTTWVLTRGDFLKPADKVEPGVPELLNDLTDDSRLAEGRLNRLQFARWISDKNSPTVARAIVNRIWHEYFGQGIVRTTEDLGTQGDYPSHPELLDWLAVELMENNWSLKHIHRLILNSATWRQSSHVTPELLARDPQNRLLARGARYRVSGETVRDIALAASGLLNRQVGGPGVYPPAPDFLFQPPASYGPKTWNTASDSQRYRRALYTFRFRSVPYPVLENFDTPRGDTACVRRNRSNTPLQALTTLNEDLFMESSRALALLILNESVSANKNAAPEHVDQLRVQSLSMRCLSRRASDSELKTIIEFLNQQRSRFSTGDDSQAWALAANDPGAPPTLPEGVTPGELAAWTATARVILNLDETITRE